MNYVWLKGLYHTDVLLTGVSTSTQNILDKYVSDTEGIGCIPGTYSLPYDATIMLPTLPA